MLANYIVTIAVAISVWSIAVLIYRNRNQAQSNESMRGLFRFNDGKRVRCVDPIEVILALDGHKEFRLDLHPAQAESGNQPAMAICRDAIQNAFGVVPFTSPDQPGLSAVEMLRLLDAFQNYCMRQKKKHRILSDLCSIHGTDAERIHRTDYETFVGLWLNRYRAICRQSMSVRYGARGAAVGFLGPMSEGYYHNISESHDEAILLRDMDTQ